MDKKLVALIESVEQIKRLLILGLSRNGASQAEIAKSLGVSQSSVSRLSPFGIGRKSTKSK